MNGAKISQFQNTHTQKKLKKQKTKHGCLKYSKEALILLWEGNRTYIRPFSAMCESLRFFTNLPTIR